MIVVVEMFGYSVLENHPIVVIELHQIGYLEFVNLNILIIKTEIS
jgi:hypothetical protein